MNYSVQFSDPSFHSWNRPKIKIVRNVINGIVYISMGLQAGKMMIGRIKIISMSNTRNNTASRKNRREKGSRALVEGLKPHSNGASISRSL